MLLTFCGIVADFVAATTALFALHAGRMTLEAVIPPFEILSTTLEQSIEK